MNPVAGSGQSFVRGLTTHQERLFGVSILSFFSTHVHLRIQEAEVDDLTLQATGMVDVQIAPNGDLLAIRAELSSARKAELLALAPTGSLEDLIRADQERLVGKNTGMEIDVKHVEVLRYLAAEGHSFERRGDGAMMMGRGAASLSGVSGIQLRSILPTPAERIDHGVAVRPPRDTLTILLPLRYRGLIEVRSRLANVDYRGNGRIVNPGVYGPVPGLDIRADLGSIVITGASGNTDVEIDDGWILVQEQRSGHVNVALREGLALLFNPNPQVTQGGETTLGKIVSQSPRLEPFCQSRALR